MRGLSWLGLGLVLIVAGRSIILYAPADWDHMFVFGLAALLVLPGLSMVLHFGIINVMTGFWRWQGFDCRPIMRTPLASASLTEFWGRRWNLAFTELTSIAIVRPLRPWVGEPTAVFAAFLASGLVHEMAISVPVGAGYGLPLLYFVLQGGAVLAERRLRDLGLALAHRGWVAHAWTLAWLALPLPMLFHPWFLAGVVWPMIGVGAVSPG
jgi:alginate O-acetyltransferase complex protein AlgI